MVKFISVLMFCWVSVAMAQKYESKIPEMLQKLKAIDMKATPAYEEAFNAAVKTLEHTVEEEKLFCSGEAADKTGWVVPKDQKQLCFRQLKNHYLDAMDSVFDLKKKYLEVLHHRQIEKLSEIQKKLRTDIEKSF